MEHAKHTAIVGLAPDWVLAKQSPAAEVWGIGALNLFRPVDLLFNMHKLEHQLARGFGTEHVQSTTLYSLNKALKDGTPVYSCETWSRYSNVIPFPLDEVIADTGIDYFTCTAAYMLAYAIYSGVERVDIFGISGRESHQHQHPCLAFWLGVATGRGMDVRSFGTETDLLRTQPRPTAPVARQWKYGYDIHPPGADKFLEEVKEAAAGV